jgi:hypothetical protein
MVLSCQTGGVMREERAVDVFVVGIEGEYAIFYFDGRRCRARFDAGRIEMLRQARPRGYDQGIRIRVDAASIEPADDA